MELTDKQKGLIQATVELIWKKGAHNPQEAGVAFEFTQLAKLLIEEQPKKGEEKKP